MKGKYKNSFRLTTKFEHYKKWLRRKKKYTVYTKKDIVESFLIPFEKLKISMQYKDDLNLLKQLK